MAKKNTLKQLSPENYIKQKARLLPIEKCYINKEWEEMKMATIIVARKHVTENTTLGFYFVDMMCLGVKDSFYEFNISKYDFLDKIEQFKLEEVPYILVHNIIYGAMAYAEDYGFSPCKAFSITSHILEEDTEDMELIDIEFGVNGKPFYMRGAEDSMVKVNQILKTLEKNAGEGNYEYAIDLDLFEDDDDFDDENDKLRQRFDDMSFEEKKQCYMKLIDLDREDVKHEIAILSESILEDLYDQNLVEKIYNDYLEKMEPYTILHKTAPLPDEVLGCTNINSHDNFEMSEVYYLWDDNRKKATQKFDKLREKFPDVPFIAFLELFILFRQKKSEQFSSLREKYLKKYPDYHMLKFMQCLDRNEIENISIPEPADFFSGRTELHPLEIFMLLHYFAVAIPEFSNPELFKSLHLLNEHFFDSLMTEEAVLIALILIFKKMVYVESYFFPE